MKQIVPDATNVARFIELDYHRNFISSTYSDSVVGAKEKRLCDRNRKAVYLTHLQIGYA